MTDLLAGLFRFTLRVIFFLFGLVFALSLLAALLVVAGLWGLRALWARVTGKPVTPWVMRMDPMAGWRRFNDMAQPAEPEKSAADRATARALGQGERADIEDAQPRQPGSR